MRISVTASFSAWPRATYGQSAGNELRRTGAESYRLRRIQRIPGGLREADAAVPFMTLLNSLNRDPK